MPSPENPWQRHQRERWRRHDAHLWTRPDAARFRKSGADPADGYRALPRKHDAAHDAAFAAEIAKGYRLLAVLRAELQPIKAELARRRVSRQEESKYIPSQPRVPAGNTGGGQWTRFGAGTATGNGGSIAQPMGAVDGGDLAGSSEVTGLFQITPGESVSDGVQLAGDGRPVDLLEEEQLGGHTVSEHVGRSDQSLLSDVRRIAASSDRKGDFAFGLREGSFTSLEAANKLVNSTLGDNQNRVDLVANGLSNKEEIDKRFGAPTGKEAYTATARSQAYIRDTDSVRVVIVPDARSAKGYRVHTAFPKNND